MTFTISISRGPDCIAMTCLNCTDEQDAVAQVQAEYPGWQIDTIRHGW